MECNGQWLYFLWREVWVLRWLWQLRMWHPYPRHPSSRIWGVAMWSEALWQSRNRKRNLSWIPGRKVISGFCHQWWRDCQNCVDFCGSGTGFSLCLGRFPAQNKESAHVKMFQEDARWLILMQQRWQFTHSNASGPGLAVIYICETIAEVI